MAVDEPHVTDEVEELREDRIMLLALLMGSPEDEDAEPPETTM
jgi:hypothetical protein